MPREFPRSRRVEEQIHRILSDVLRAECPRPGSCINAVVTEVRVSRDLSVAWVYVTSLDADARSPGRLLDACQRAGRASCAARWQPVLSVRQTPELRFRIDDDRLRPGCAHMDALIDSVVDRRGPTTGT